MDLTLIIPAHNEESCIGETLDMAIKHTHGKLREIVVVDNASTDRTAEVAQSRPGVRVVFEPRKGLTSARQGGFNATQGEWVAYIDADTHITARWIDLAEKIIAERPDIVSLSGPRRYFGSSWWRIWILNAMWYVAPLTYRIVGYMILGGNFIAKRSAIEKIGGFDRVSANQGFKATGRKRQRRTGGAVYRRSGKSSERIFFQ